MSCSLPADCLNEILEKLEGDKITLHSCLLVNRLWCKISVRILWRDIWKFKFAKSYFVPRRICSRSSNRSLRFGVQVASSILSTLISCLSNESKELLNKNEIFISAPTSKQPLFNYAAFFRGLSIKEIC